MLDELRTGLAEADDESFLMPGAKLGRYTLVRRLAIGGMAEIHLARATGLMGFEKLVVLKRILPQFASNDDFVGMFLDEARLAATLDHPNIVQVHDVGLIGRSYFMAMEYLQGTDVRHIQIAARKARRALTLAEALAIAIPTAQGLNYAHDKLDADGRALGIVHRDVSPANIIVTREGGVKLVDFGIAKSALRHTETRAGTLKGKISYMSPEQCRGDAIDRRSDVFALGVVLYELTCGARPFVGDNEYAVLTKIIGGVTPSPSTHRPDYPEDLADIVRRALASRPEDRFATTRELVIALEAHARAERLDVGPGALTRLLQELSFAHRTDARGTVPPPTPTPAPLEPLDDSLAYSVVIEAAAAGPPTRSHVSTGDFDDPPSARLPSELSAYALSAALGSAPIRQLPLQAPPPDVPPLVPPPTRSAVGAAAARRARKRALAVTAAVVLGTLGTLLGAKLLAGGDPETADVAPPAARATTADAPMGLAAPTLVAPIAAPAAATTPTAVPTPTPTPMTATRAAPAPAPSRASPAPTRAAPAPSRASPAPTRAAPAPARTKPPAKAKPAARPSTWDPDSALPPGR